MLRAEGLLVNRSGPFVERLGLLVAALGLENQGQVVEARSHIGMLGAEGFLTNDQGELRQGKRLRIPAGLVEAGHLSVETLCLLNLSRISAGQEDKQNGG